jgi:UDP-glucose 4-epimerase
VLELVTTFEEVNNLKLNYKIGPRRPGDTIRIYGDVSKANKFLNWRTEKTLKEALRDAWRWEKKLELKK